MYQYMYMASINISLKKEAYESLVALKRPNESFSDEILRIAKKSTGADLVNCFDLMSKISKKSELEFEEGMKKAKMKMSSILEKWEE